VIGNLLSVMIDMQVTGEIMLLK
jgi:hypothetical protein